MRSDLRFERPLWLLVWEETQKGQRQKPFFFCLQCARSLPIVLHIFPLLAGWWAEYYCLHSTDKEPNLERVGYRPTEPGCGQVSLATQTWGNPDFSGCPLADGMAFKGKAEFVKVLNSLISWNQNGEPKKAKRYSKIRQRSGVGPGDLGICWSWRKDKGLGEFERFYGLERWGLGRLPVTALVSPN